MLSRLDDLPYVRLGDLPYVATVCFDFDADGFPPHTRLLLPAELGHDRGPRLGMYTFLGREGAHVSVIDLQQRAGWTGWTDHRWAEWAIGELERVRQLHWFGLAHRRGGYC